MNSMLYIIKLDSLAPKLIFINFINLFIWSWIFQTLDSDLEWIDKNLDSSPLESLFWNFYFEINHVFHLWNANRFDLLKFLINKNPLLLYLFAYAILMNAVEDHSFETLVPGALLFLLNLQHRANPKTESESDDDDEGCKEKHTHACSM